MEELKIGLSYDGKILLVNDIHRDNIFSDRILISENSIIRDIARVKIENGLKEYNLKSLTVDEALTIDAPSILIKIKYFVESILSLQQKADIKKDNTNCFVNLCPDDISLYQKKQCNRYDMLRIGYCVISQETLFPGVPHNECEECSEWEPISIDTYEYIEYYIKESIKQLHHYLKIIYINK